MKNILFTLLLFAGVIPLHAQIKCNDDSIMTIIGKWKKIEDANMVPGKNLANIISRLDNMSKLFKTAYPKPRGTQAEWYRSMGVYPMVDNGPAGYDFGSLYQYWYCNENNNKLTLSVETANWGRVLVNNLVGKGFIDGQNDLLKIKVAGNEVYILPKPKGEWKGYPMYDFDGMRSVVLTHNDQFPWIAITQEQYLNALKESWQNEKKKSADGYAEMIAETKKAIKEWQDKKDVPLNFKNDMISSLQKNLEESQKMYPEQLEKTIKFWDDKITVIDNYKKENETQLTKPAIVERSPDQINNFSGTFSKSDEGHLLVMFDPSYFKKSLPDYVPQVMVLSWTWGNDKPGLYYKKQIEENFPVEKLQEMLDK